MDRTRASIVLIVSSFPKLSETFIVNKFLGLLDSGWDVHLVCNRHDFRAWNSFPQLQRRSDVWRRVHINAQQRQVWLAALAFPLVLLRTILQRPLCVVRYLARGWREDRFGVLKKFYADAQIIANAPQIVHFEFGTLATNRMYLRRWLNCRITVSFRGFELNFSGLDRPNYYRQVWRHADRIHLLSRDLWLRALKRGCPRTKPHTLIPPAVDPNLFDATCRAPATDVGSRRRPVRIVCVSRLHWKKGLEYALSAIRLVKDRRIECEVRLIGAGEYLEAVTFARHQLKLEQTVQLLGDLPPDEVKQHLLWADVFLHAAVSEGFCNSVLEAQLMRLPVVCSDADGLAENVIDGVTGFVVTRRSAEALAERLIELANDSALRCHLGEAGRDRVESHFCLDGQRRAFDEFYAEVLDSTSQAPGKRHSPIEASCAQEPLQAVTELK